MQHLAFDKRLSSFPTFAFLAATLLVGCGDNQTVTSNLPADAPVTTLDASIHDGTLAVDSPSLIDSAATGIDASTGTFDAAIPAPIIGSVAPSFGPAAGGTTITIFGSNLTGTTTVTFGGVAGTSLTVLTDLALTVVTPLHAAGAVDVVVTTPGGSATDASAFTYVAAASVTSISPATGTPAGGTSVTITGTGFNNATAVRFGISPTFGFVLVSDTEITALTPAHTAGVVDVIVASPSGNGSLPNGFTYGLPPSITALTPPHGFDFGGTAVTISGTSFTGTTAVQFGGASAQFNVVDDTTLTVTTPAGTGVVDVTVTTPLGETTDNSAYTYDPS